MKELIVSFIYNFLDLDDCMVGYSLPPNTGKGEFVYYSIQSYSKQLGENDVVYLVEVEYYNTDYQQVNKTITISNEQLLVYLFSKI